MPPRAISSSVRLDVQRVVVAAAAASRTAPEPIGGRELRGAAEAAVGAGRRCASSVADRARRACSALGRRRRARSSASARVGSAIVAGPLADLVASLAPGLDAPPPAPCGSPACPRRVVGREVGAAEERVAVGVEEDGHRPAAVAGHRLHGRHVDLVEVGPLLAVDLDVDEVLVHEGRRSRGSRSTRAPSRGTSGRPSSRSRGRSAGPRSRARAERLRAPGIPVDRVVRVLEQVGAGLAGEAVGHRSQPTLQRRRLFAALAKFEYLARHSASECRAVNTFSMRARSRRARSGDQAVLAKLEPADRAGRRSARSTAAEKTETELRYLADHDSAHRRCSNRRALPRRARQLRLLRRPLRRPGRGDDHRHRRAQGGQRPARPPAGRQPDPPRRRRSCANACAPPTSSPASPATSSRC